MTVKLVDSEIKVMNVLWERGDMTAKEISNILNDTVGWNMNTTYTLIKRCIKKGAIKRTEPKFMCHALIEKEKIQEQETKEFIAKIFDGSAEMLFASLLNSGNLSNKEIERLKQLVKEME